MEERRGGAVEEVTGTREDGWNKEIGSSKLMGEQIEKRCERRGREKRRIAGKERSGRRRVGKGGGEEGWGRGGMEGNG